MNNVTCNRSRPIFLRFACWTMVFLGLPIAFWACVSHPLEQPSPAPRQVTDAYITVAPMRHLDLLFMVDNSGSMANKQLRLAKELPRLFPQAPAKDWFADPKVAEITAFLTVFYMFRMWYLTFHGRSRVDRQTASHMHESPRVMLVPMSLYCLVSEASWVASTPVELVAVVM